MLTIPTVPRSLGEEEIAALREGDRANIDSGMGGSFSVKFTGYREDRFVFDIESKDFESLGPVEYTFDQVRERVYELVVDPRSAREVELLTGKEFSVVQQDIRERDRRYWHRQDAKRAGGRAG